MERDALRQLHTGGRGKPPATPISLSTWYENTATELKKRGLVRVHEDVTLPTGLLWCSLTNEGLNVVNDVFRDEVPS
jgi:hypothetical protein